MENHDVPSSSMIDWISDDMNFLRVLPQCPKPKDKSDGFYDPLRQAHDARLLVVFGYAMIEGFTKHVARGIGVDKKISTIDLVKELDYPQGLLTIGSLDELSILLEGIKNLRHIVAHGLTTETADQFEKKIRKIQKANLPVDPTKLSEVHFSIIFEVIDNITNILGSGLVVYNENKRNA